MAAAHQIGNLPLEIWSYIIDNVIDLGGHEVFHGIVQIMGGALGAGVAASARAAYGPAQIANFRRVCMSDHHEHALHMTRCIKVTISEIHLAEAKAMAAAAGSDSGSSSDGDDALVEAAEAQLAAAQFA